MKVLATDRVQTQSEPLKNNNVLVITLIVVIVVIVVISIFVIMKQRKQIATLKALPQ